MTKKHCMMVCFVCIFMNAFCQQDNDLYMIKLSFKNMAGGKLLHLDSSYINAFKESYTITQFKYYISNISFSDTTGNETNITDSYFLIDESNTGSKSMLLTVVANNISAIHFYIGVDSAKSLSGIYNGALDPANGMYWTWSSGHIMAKMEAIASCSKAPMHRVIYHIGGFGGGYNTVRKVSLSLPRVLKIRKGGTGEIVIAADINKWFTGKYDIKIADMSLCMTPGALANRIAANYAAMFTVIHVHNN